MSLAPRLKSDRNPVPQILLDRIRQLVGDKACITDPEAQKPHLVEWRDLFTGKTPMVVKPGNTEEVAAVVKLCREYGVPIVPQGGNTSLVGASLPFEHGGEIVLSLQRMNRILDIDPLNYTMTVEAGVILQTIQQAASDADRLFPLSLGAEGSCLIGGNLSTNAGGIQVLHYGNARNLVLGLEVVLADGQIWDGMRALKKDNTGYDLKNLFMGAEGTLGIITRAVLKLFPKPKDMATAFIAVPNPKVAVEILSAAREASEDNVTSFEFMGRLGLDFVLRHTPGVVDPIQGKHEWYVLMEWSSPREGGGLKDKMESFLGEMLEQGKVLDAAPAQSAAQRTAFWKIREAYSGAQKPEGGSIKHDVSVAVAKMPEFLERASKAVLEAIPDGRVIAFGHLGDGNAHFNLSQPVGADREAFLARWDEINRIVHDIVVDMNGSISAEHGIGRMKVEELEHYRSKVELDLMRKIKRALDPDNLLNPHKVVEV
jgi:FAD/FMN-containing dehydrogenase